MAVHVRGTLKVLDKEEVYASVKKLMDTYESPQENPIDMDALSESTLRQIKGIVGFEIKITSIEAAKKMSQNRDDKNHTAVVSRLRENGNTRERSVADEMERLRGRNLILKLKN